MKKTRASRWSLCVSLLCVALSACQASQDVGSMIQSGRKYLEAGDRKSAVIQFKNVLQQQPDSAEARFLLGKTLLEAGDPAAAAVELRKALELNHPASLVQPLLARSLLMEGKPRVLIEKYAAAELPDPAADAELKTLRARAHLMLDEPEKADALLRAILSGLPHHTEATLLQARALAARQEHDAAFALVDGLLARAPDTAEAWQLKGDLLMRALRQPEAALDAYRKALAANPKLLDAHAALLAIFVGRNEQDAVAAQLKQLREHFPGHPQTLYHEVQLAMLKRDHKAAKEGVQKLLTLTPDDVKALQLAGWVEFQSGSLLQAENHLARALQISPDLPLALRVLARTHLRAGRPEKALALVQPMIDKAGADASLLSLAAEALLQQGDLARAEALFARAAQLEPRNAANRTALAVTRLARGQVAAATTELELIAASDPGTAADLALIGAQLRQKRQGAALKAIDRLEQKAPKQPLAPYLRGTVQLTLKKLPEARASFEQALTLDPVYLPAVARLAQLDLADGKAPQARERFERVLAVDARNLPASMALVELRARAGAPPAEVETMLADVVRAHPSEEKPRLALIEQHLRQKDARKALQAAGDAVAALPASVPLLNALGQAQLAAGEPQQAISTFSKLTAQHPDSAQAHLRLAGAHLSIKDFAAAEQSLQRALRLEPASTEAQRQLVGLHHAAGHPQQALLAARAMQKQPANEALGLQLEGDIEAAQGRWGAAAAAYRASLTKAESGALAARLHLALSRSGKQAEADGFAEQWTRSHPQDAVFHSQLADLALGSKDYARAERHFLRVLEAQPANVVALNNLAWVLLQQGKPDATGYAEKAYQLQPGRPAVLDTLAECLAKDRQWARAIEMQKKAAELEAANPSYRLRLARIYLGAGQKEQARAELAALSKLDKAAALQTEVAQLMQSL